MNEQGHWYLFDDNQNMTIQLTGDNQSYATSTDILSDAMKDLGVSSAKIEGGDFSLDIQESDLGNFLNIKSI